MDLSFSPAEEAFRAEVREWLAANVPSGLPSFDTPAGFAAHQEWERRMYDARLSVVTWPEQYGGRGASLTEWLIFEEEYYAAGAPGRVSQNGIFLLAPALLEVGTDAQKTRFLPPMARGDEIWAQGWSEPEAGSDLANVASRAERVTGGWRLSGQKTWSSRAALGHWLFGLFRTDPQSRRHRGLTYFLVPLNAAGVTVRGIRQLDGEAGFAEIFFDGVFVPDDQVLGEPGQGWTVAMATTGAERGLTLRSPGRFLAAADRLVGLARTRAAGAAADPDKADPDEADPDEADPDEADPDEADPDEAGADEAVAQAWIEADAYRWYTFQTLARLQDGHAIGPESSVNKLFWSQLDLRLHETALRLLGPDGELPGPWLDGFLFALAGPIYGGTNEVQRNIVAERVLGLPRESRPKSTPNADQEPQ